ncbi:MAG: hypothetical protein OEW12_07780, partial [Deltaproteobacteria bacterium]|nr:hypothetical protein [Deltaproteobacteria bacterium]
MGLITAAAGLAYADSFWGVVQFDDHPSFLDFPPAASWAAWWDSLPAIRPLLKASYVFNNTSGWGVAGFHLVNLALHLANSLLVYGLLTRLVHPARRGLPTGPSIPPAPVPAAIPLVTALVFALHPAQTEAVTYLSGRSVSLMAFFYLSSMMFYSRGTPWGRGLSLGAFGLALLVKETAVTLPAALLLWEVAARPARRLPGILAHQWPHWLMLAAALATFGAAPIYAPYLQASLTTRPIGENLVLQVHAVWYLLEGAVLVHPPNIDPDLAWAMGHSPPLAVKGLVLAGLAGWGVLAVFKRPILGFGLVWFFLHLAPTNSLIPRYDPVNDRQLYLPIMGLAWAVGLAGVAGWEKIQGLFRGIPRGILPGMAVLVVIWLGLGTASRNLDYRSEVALWEATAAQSPRKGRVFNNLGYAYHR